MQYQQNISRTKQDHATESIILITQDQKKKHEKKEPARGSMNTTRLGSSMNNTRTLKHIRNNRKTT
jgi:hypothetical protein